MSSEVPVRSIPSIVDLVVIGTVEVIKTQYTYLTHIVSCRREVKRIDDGEASSPRQSPSNPLKVLPTMLRRQGLYGMVWSCAPLLLGRVAIELNVRIIGGLLRVVLPQYFSPTSFVGSTAFLSAINLLMLPSVAPATLLSAKYYGQLPPPRADKDSLEPSQPPSALRILRSVPVRSWYAKSWMIPLGDVAKQIALRALASSFDGVIGRFIGAPRVALFAAIFTVGQAVVYPVQLTYLRYLTALGTPKEYHGIRDTFETIRREGGLGAFYDGFALSSFASLLSFMLQ